MRFALGLVTGVILTLLVPIAVVAAGVVNMGAIRGPGVLETIFGSWATERWMHARAPDEVPTAPPTTEAWQAGFTHYSQSCVHCHGAPDVEPSVFGRTMSPPPPDLSVSARDLTEAQLYLVVHDGVRMSGMPAFGRYLTDEEIAQVVRFVRDIEHVTPEQKRTLAAITAHDYDVRPAEPLGAPAAEDPPATTPAEPADPPQDDAVEPADEPDAEDPAPDAT